MKTLKKVLSIILVIAMFSSMLALVSCGKASNKLTVGQWLSIIIDRFEIQGESAKTPYIESVNVSDEYFDVVQTAYEWGTIDDSMDLNVDDAVSKEFCAISLVKTVGFEDTEGLSNDEIAQIAVDEGYITYQYKGHVDSGREVTLDEAKSSLDKSYSIWANHDFGEIVESVEYTDDVVVVGQNLKNNTETLDNSIPDKIEDIYYPDKHTVIIPKNLAKGISAGKTYIVPSANGDIVAYKAESVQDNGEFVVVSNSSSGAEFEDTVKELHASGTFVPDFTQATITDGIGNTVNQSSETENVDLFEDITTQFLNAKPDVSEMAKDSFELNFEIDNLKIKGKVNKSSISFSVTGTLDKSDKEKVEVSKSYEIKDVKLNYDYDYSWFKLHSAYAKLDYTTVDKTSAKYTYSFVDGSFGPKYSNGNGKFLTNLKRAVLKGASDKGAKSIKICSIPLVSGGIASFNLDIKIKISFSGEITLEITTNNVKGIQYKNGKLSYIKEEKKDYDFKAECKLEATLYLGVSFNAIGFEIVGAGIEGGLGAKASITVHLADSENHLLDEIQLTDCNPAASKSVFESINGMSYEHISRGTLVLHSDVCCDLSVYFILKFTISHDSLICKFCDIEYSKTFLDEKNAKIKELSGHFENGTLVSQCTHKYQEFEEEETTENEKVTAVEKGETILLDSYFSSLSVGETYKINVESAPNGFENTDVVFESANEAVAKVDSHGNVTAVSPGVVEIRASIKDPDGKVAYKTSCSIYVIGEAETFQEIISKQFSWKSGNGGSR